MISKNIFVVLIAIFFATNFSCKKKQGEFNLQELNAQIFYYTQVDNSAFHFQVKGVTLNFVKGKFKKWYFTVYDEENNELFKISDENYLNIAPDIKIQNTEIDLYYTGFLIVKSESRIPGDIMNGKTPDRILLRCTIEDQYGNETELVSVGIVQFLKL